jgi:hypothetical protein
MTCSEDLDGKNVPVNASAQATYELQENLLIDKYTKVIKINIYSTCSKSFLHLRL